MANENVRKISMEENEQQRKLAKKLHTIIKCLKRANVGYKTFTSSTNFLGRKFPENIREPVSYVFRFSSNINREKIDVIFRENNLKMVAEEMLFNPKDKTNDTLLLVSLLTLNDKEDT